MEVTLSSQLLSLGISALVGLALAVVYDVFRVTRILFRTGKIAMYVQDILYGIAAAFITFLLALAVNSGEIRFYIIGGELIGMAVYFSYFRKNYCAYCKMDSSYLRENCVMVQTSYQRTD
ncbi:MAG: spore cortex biosynthesis protein YabQ [Eubacteriales bacterium]